MSGNQGGVVVGSRACRAREVDAGRGSASARCAPREKKSSCSTATSCAHTSPKGSASPAKIATSTSRASPSWRIFFARNGVVVLVAAISPYRVGRDHARETIGDFVEVHVAPPVEECIKRDVKGLYQKALAGEIPQFTGVNDPYEEPLSAELTLDTSKLSVDQATCRYSSDCVSSATSRTPISNAGPSLRRGSGVGD